MKTLILHLHILYSESTSRLSRVLLSHSFSLHIKTFKLYTTKLKQFSYKSDNIKIHTAFADAYINFLRKLNISANFIKNLKFIVYENMKRFFQRFTTINKIRNADNHRYKGKNSSTSRLYLFLCSHSAKRVRRCDQTVVLQSFEEYLPHYGYGLKYMKLHNLLKYGS